MLSNIPVSWVVSKKYIGHRNGYGDSCDIGCSSDMTSVDIGKVSDASIFYDIMIYYDTSIR